MGECRKLGDVDYVYSRTIGDYALQIELVDPEKTKSELYRFSLDGKLHHWCDAEDKGHQGTDTSFDDVYPRLERAGFLTREYQDWRIRHVQQAMIGYARSLRARERNAATVPSIDAVVDGAVRYAPGSMASERQRRRDARNECRDALGLPRL